MFSRKKKPAAEQPPPPEPSKPSNRASSTSNHSGQNAGPRGSGMSATSNNPPAARSSAQSQQQQRDAGDKNSDDEALAQPMSRVNLTAIPDYEDDDDDRPRGSRAMNNINYAAERVIGSGSFGIVYQATVIETGESVAIKKVLQDRRFKNRELQIMRMLNHPSVVTLKHSFMAKGDVNPEEVYLNLVMEFIPETIHRTVRNHTKAKKLVPPTFIKLYMYQVCRALAYIHSLGVCHRDIKPQNLLLDPNTHMVKLCDFGSAKILLRGQPNVAYICSRYYRAPELVFEATEYDTSIDIWSMGCVMAELLLGKPLFPGESGVGQLIEIIKIMGTPTREEIAAMNPNHSTFSFPSIAPHPWSRIFRGRGTPEAIDLLSKFLVYKPQDRLSPFKALVHPFFDELRDPSFKLGTKTLPNIFNFTVDEIKMAEAFGIRDKLIPPHIRQKLQIPDLPAKEDGKP